jgi:hypothetical protein
MSASPEPVRIDGNELLLTGYWTRQAEIDRYTQRKLDRLVDDYAALNLWRSSDFRGSFPDLASAVERECQGRRWCMRHIGAHTCSRYTGHPGRCIATLGGYVLAADWLAEPNILDLTEKAVA